MNIKTWILHHWTVAIPLAAILLFWLWGVRKRKTDSTLFSIIIITAVSLLILWVTR